MNTNGMRKETYELIDKNIAVLDLDLENGKILNRKATKPNTHGYLETSIGGKRVKQHQVFAVVRWGKSCIGMTVNHKNENKLDNSWVNLELLSNEDNLKARKGTIGRPGKPIKAVNIMTGEEKIFSSQPEASRCLGISVRNINRVLMGKWKYTKGYIFERSDLF